MINLVSLPKLNYILFELLQFQSIKVEDSDEPLIRCYSLGIVLMDVQPASMDYDYGSKKNYIFGQGDDNVRVYKGGLLPVKVNFSGVFGHRTISRGIIGRDGFQRLKEFIELFKNSQGINKKDQFENDKNNNYFYGVNYYDFTNHIWGTADLDRFKVICDSRTSTQVPTYNLSFTIIGDLTDTVNKVDPILRNLKYFIKVYDYIEDKNKELEDIFLHQFGTFNEIMVDIEFANLYFSEAMSLISSTFLGIARTGSEMVNNVFGMLTSNNLLISTGNTTSRTVNFIGELL